MSGRQQHYLPQFLQRPFRHRTHKNKDYVYAHEGTRSYTPSTMGLGQERDFYGHPDESIADGNITNSETRLAEILNRLNSDPNRVSQEDHAHLLAALAVRTRKLRDSLSGLVKTISAEMADYFQRKESLRREIETYWSDEQKLNSLISEELRKYPGIPEELRVQLTLRMKKEWHQQREHIVAKVNELGQALATEFFSRMDKESAAVADNAFRKIFERDPTIPARAESLTALYEFSMIEAPEDAEFILGDCAAVGFRSDGAPRLPIGDLNDETPLAFIFLPISPRRCVMAAKRGTTALATVGEINRASAGLSHHFFISKSPDPVDLQILRALIGTAEPLVSEGDVRWLMESNGDGSAN